MMGSDEPFTGWTTQSPLPSCPRHPHTSKASHQAALHVRSQLPAALSVVLAAQASPRGSAPHLVAEVVGGLGRHLHMTHDHVQAEQLRGGVHHHTGGCAVGGAAGQVLLVLLVEALVLGRSTVLMLSFACAVLLLPVP
jgi:hypothetical protein